MPQRKKAGCNSYASVTDDYTLYNKEASTVVATTKGGVRRRGGNSSLTDALSSMSSSLGVNTNTLSQGMTGLFGTTEATSQESTTVTGGNRRSKRGGSSSCSATRYGGFYEEVPSTQLSSDGLDTVANMLTNTTKSVSDSLFGTDTAKTGGSRHRRGGAVELAPFAASLAFLAARMSMDDKLNFSKLLNLKNNKEDETDEEEEREMEYEEYKKSSKGSRSKNSRD
jgi:hypothetical protein